MPAPDADARIHNNEAEILFKRGVLKPIVHDDGVHAERLKQLCAGRPIPARFTSARSTGSIGRSRAWCSGRVRPGPRSGGDTLAQAPAGAKLRPCLNTHFQGRRGGRAAGGAAGAQGLMCASLMAAGGVVSGGAVPLSSKSSMNSSP